MTMSVPSIGPAAPSNSTESVNTGAAAGESDAERGPDGVEGGTGTDPRGAGHGEGSPIPVGRDVREPRLVHRVEPVYPETARKVRAEGVVILEAIITTDGRVEELRVLRSPNPLLSEAAVSAVGLWRYLPATLNGRPVRVFLTVTVDFKLH
jgi:protein TonB